MDAGWHMDAEAKRGKLRSSLSSDTVRRTALLGVLALALALRLYGLNWDSGFPYTPHPDERAILMKVEQLSLPALGDIGVLFNADESPWNPRWFPYGSLPLYMLKGVQLVYSLVPGVELTDLRIAGRAISALADVATVMLVFLLGSRLYGRRVGVLASLLAALAVIHIQLSHFFAVDTLLALFAVLAVYFLYGVARDGRLRDSVLAGAVIGLGLATKVSLAPIFAAFAMAHLMYAVSAIGEGNGDWGSFKARGTIALKGLAAGAAASLVVLLVVQPYTLLDWGRFYGSVVEQSEMVRRIRDYPYTRQYIDTTPYWYHVRQLAVFGFGWPLGIVAWAGLLYASLRGMRWRLGIGYLAVGWGLPAALLLLSSGFISIFLASVIAFAALAATLLFRSRESRLDVLLLSWVVPYFLIIGAFEVKFLRYLIPITPFLLLFASRMLLALWQTASQHRPALRPWLAAGLALLVGSAGFYALSYMNIYRQPHTAVRASEWINENVPAGSIILKEHWEEGLPGLSDYDVHELPLYDTDTSRKIDLLSEELARADYMVFFSHRLYATIPRLPERYPASAAYYRKLFSGELGYKLADPEATYPGLGFVAFADDTFGRANVPEPDGLRTFRPSRLTLDMGFADESFSVYDHPKVLIMRNVERYDAGSIRAIIDSREPSNAISVSGAPARTVGLMFSPRDAERQQAGGTWRDIVSPGSWTNRLPVVAWLLVVEVIAILALPITLVVFRPLADRGYLFSKALGLLLVGLIVWLLASLEWMAFSRDSIVVALLALGVASAVVLARSRGELFAFVRERWRVLFVGEVLFLAAFFAFLLIRAANPDLWHPYRGGEKPMDFAYLNAVLRSSYMPPYDPWFGGGFLNYYYWGQFLVSMLIKFTGIEPAVAFNLAVPLLFALTVGGSYTVVYNLAEGTRSRLERSSAPCRGGSKLAWSPVAAGVGAALFVAVIGNLDGAIQVGEGVWRAVFQQMPFGAFDFWRSSRMMAPDPPGYEVTEFPFFSFLFADLHAHMIALPFTVLALGLALAVVLGAGRRGDGRPDWSAGHLATLAALGLTLGSLTLLNAWDFPTYVVLGLAALLLAEIVGHGGVGLPVLARSAAKAAFVLGVGYLAFLPFHTSSEVFFNGLEATTNTTVLWQFLAIGGLFIFIVGSFFVLESKDWLVAGWRASKRRFARFAEADTTDGDPAFETGKRTSVAWAAVLAILVVGTLVAAAALGRAFYGVAGSTVPFVALLLTLVFVAGVRRLLGGRADSPHVTFVALMVGVALVLAIGLEVFRVEGDIDRMNSVFKVYLQIWVLLALGSAYLLWRLAYGRRAPLWKLAWAKKAWVAALVVLVASASVYPVLGTQDRLRDRFDGRVTPLTLDGTAFIDGAVYRDQNGDIDLAADFKGITWLKESVEGSPIVLEGHTPTYRWGGRVSVYTGLPSVVGWQWHQEQQRWGYRWAVGDRIDDVNRIYGTTNPSEAMSLLRRYRVRYVYVGELERLYYPKPGLDKFEGGLDGQLDKVFESGPVAIYRVRDAGL